MKGLDYGKWHGWSRFQAGIQWRWFDWLMDDAADIALIGCYKWREALRQFEGLQNQAWIFQRYIETLKLRTADIKKQSRTLQLWPSGFSFNSCQGLGSIVSYGQTMAAVSERRRWRLTLGLFEELSVQKLQRSVIACNIVSSAAVRCKQWEIALNLLGLECFELWICCTKKFWCCLPTRQMYVQCTSMYYTSYICTL